MAVIKMGVRSSSDLQPVQFVQSINLRYRVGVTFYSLANDCGIKHCARLFISEGILVICGCPQSQSVINV